MTEAAHLIGGEWRPGSGEAIASENPATGEVIWRTTAAGAPEVEAAVAAARQAFPGWSGRAQAERTALAEAFANVLERNREALAGTIAEETGKPLWEARTEVGAMIGKVPISIRAHAERTGATSSEQQGVRTALTHRPHGVMAVYGPYNFPGHLPNGHIVPALLAGNTVVFKPSELTPKVAEVTARCWEEAGAPPGVVNLVQGGRETGQALSGHAGVDGILFTGSAEVGHLLHRQFGGRPEKILALEMGGNNPLVVWSVSDPEAAVFHIIQSAFITAGQRCTCARRLIVAEGDEGAGLVARLADAVDRIRVGPPDDEPQPFMGPVISNRAADMLLEGQERILARGGRPIRHMARLEDGRPFLAPGLVDVTDVQDHEDKELFGPFLQIVRVTDFDAAVAEANRTAFGLAAGLLSDDASLYDRFHRSIRAGIVNWNRPTSGASSAAPFGGIGASGNHRPSAYYAADYCAYPVASLEADRLVVPESVPPGLG